MSFESDKNLECMYINHFLFSRTAIKTIVIVFANVRRVAIDRESKEITNLSA